jgi:hypothetical protein
MIMIITCRNFDITVTREEPEILDWRGWVHLTAAGHPFPGHHFPHHCNGASAP